MLARYRFLDQHLDRMAASALALGLPFERAAAREVMVGLARVSPGAAVVRIQLDAAGHFGLSTRAAPTETPDWGAATRGEAVGAQPVKLLVSPFRTDPDDPFLRHKTSIRGFYNREHRRALHQGCFDALFLNRLDRVTEGAITNLFARLNEGWVTPPAEDGLLAGVWRAWFLNETGAAQRPLTLAELLAADEIVVGNSVRGKIRVGTLVAGPLVV